MLVDCLVDEKVVLSVDLWVVEMVVMKVVVMALN